jgi:hypothetical protein
MKKFVATQGDLTAELSNNTIFIEGSYILNGDIHNLRIWLDRLDDEMNEKLVVNTDKYYDDFDDHWLPEDIYGTSENVE